MPSTVVDMTLATRILATEKRNAKIKPTDIVVDNVAPADDAVLTFNDVFTPSVTNAVPIPVLTTVPRLRVTVALGTCVSASDRLKNIEFLGLVQVVRGAANAGCVITFVYEHQ